MAIEQVVKGTCFCGAVEVTTRGQPVAMGYCHCESCRHWSAGPVNAFTLWRPETVSVTGGAAQLGSYAKNPQSVRRFCRTCGGHVLTEHPTMGLTDVYSAAHSGRAPEDEGRASGAWRFGRDAAGVTRPGQSALGLPANRRHAFNRTVRRSRVVLP